jgi:hypothetical protein
VGTEVDNPTLMVCLYPASCDQTSIQEWTKIIDLHITLNLSGFIAEGEECEDFKIT